LDKRTQGSSTEIGKLFTRQRAQTGFSLFSNRVDEVNDTLKELKEGTIDYANANDIALNNVGRQWEILGTKISNTFLSLGKIIVDSTIKTAEFFGLFDDVKIANEVEKEEAKIRAANDKLIESNNEVIEKYIQGLNFEVAQANIANNKIIAANNVRIAKLTGSFDTYKNHIVSGYKALIATVKNDIKGFSTELDKITAGGKSFADFGKDFKLDLGKQAFELDLEDKTVSRQLEALSKRKVELEVQLKNTDIFDYEEQKRIIGRITELVNQGISITRTANKENKKAGEERLKIQKEQKKLEKETQEIQQRYNLALLNIEVLRGKTVAEKNKLREAAAKDYGKKLKAISDEQKDYEKELSGLKATNITQEFANYRKQYENINKLITTQRENQQEAEKTRINELTTERAKSIILLGELEKRVRETNAFDLKKLLASGDIDIINKGVAEYEKAAQALVAVQSQLGVKDTGTDKEVKDIRKAADLTIVNIRNKELQKQQREYNDIVAKAAKERLKLITDNEKEINAKLSKTRTAAKILEKLTISESQTLGGYGFDKPELARLKEATGFLSKLGKGLDPKSTESVANFNKQVMLIGEELRKTQDGLLVDGIDLAASFPKIGKVYSELLDLTASQTVGIEEQIKKTNVLRTSNADLLTQAENWKKSAIGIKDKTQETLTVTQQIATLEKQMTDNMVLRAETQDRLNKSTLSGMMEQAAFAKEQIVNTFDILGGLFNTPVLKANGGRINGTDTVPAMLTPGEFVVNKYASQRFLSELTAIMVLRGMQMVVQ